MTWKQLYVLLSSIKTLILYASLMPRDLVPSTSFLARAEMGVISSQVYVGEKNWV